MRELDPTSPPEVPACAVVGAGRLGTVMAAALSAGPPLRRGEPLPDGTEVVLLCVPDGQIAAATSKVPDGPLVGHCSGATGLEALGAREGFSLHPLMSVPKGSDPGVLRGAGAAVDANSPRALAAAHALAAKLGLRATRVEPQDRVAYHAAGAMAANFLVALEACAERLAATAGVTREQLAPLVLATAQQWAAMGPEAALTGPIVRGDEAVVARHRATVAERTPEMLALWDALADATRQLAGRTRAMSDGAAAAGGGPTDSGEAQAAAAGGRAPAARDGQAPAGTAGRGPARPGDAPAAKAADGGAAA